MSIERTKKLYEVYVMDTYSGYGICLVRGEGSVVWDIEGKKYLDFISGISVLNLGYSHPEWVSAIQKQAGKIVHSSNLFYIEPQAELARILVKNSFDGRCFFCNSGAEANEAAIKLARLFTHKYYGQDRFEIITFEQSFHGRTLATITATGQKKYQEGFDPLMPGFVYSPFNDIEALKSKINKHTCAIMLELIQAEGGVNVIDKKFIKQVAALCRENNLLLIIDEVQTAIGRCGDLFAYKLFGVKPDIFTLAKALGNGFPIGAMIAKKELTEVFTPGTHASTFGGNHLACTAGMAVLDTILKKDFFADVNNMGQYLFEQLSSLKNKYYIVKDIRGMGMMWGMELAFSAHKIVSKCREKGILLNCVQDRILRFIPPLIIKKEEIDQMIEVLDEVLNMESRR